MVLPFEDKPPIGSICPTHEGRSGEMTVYGLMTSIRVSSDKDSIAVIEEFVAERLAAKDKEIGELKAKIELLTEANKGLGNGYDLVLESSDRHLSEVYRLREGMEGILRSQEYEGFLLVSPALVESLLKMPPAVVNPAHVDNSMQQDGEKS